MKTMSRDAAIAAGLKRYFTGEACRRGHVAERYASYGGCCECERAKLTAWQKTPRGRELSRKYSREPAALARSRAYRKRRKARNPWFEILRAAKQRARRKGIPFDLDHSELRMPKTCPVLGIPLIPGLRRKHAGSPSLDRLIPERGYTRENVRVISYRANMLKNDASAAELRAVADWMERELAK